MFEEEVRAVKGVKTITNWVRGRAVWVVGAYGVLTIAWPVRALAATTGTLPWDTTLTTLQTDLQGPVAHAVTTAAIIGTGIMWSVSEHGTGVRKMSALAFGGSAALGASTLMTALFPAAGALF
jgi:type IV secretory pathway VirB2 component (pilin)